MSFAFVNNLFDATSFDEPVKQFIDDNLFLILDISKTKYANLFVQLSSAFLAD